MTHKSMWIITLVFATIFAPTVLRASPTDIQYTVVDLAGGSVTGTITTDGTTGTLNDCPSASCDIVSWDLTLNDGSNSVTITRSNSVVYIQSYFPGDITASPTSLMFNFSAAPTDKVEFEFYTSSAGNPNEVCWTSDSDCISTPTSIVVGNVDNDGKYLSTTESGDLIIASVSATPEPSTAILWLTGIVLMILTRKRIAHLLRLGTGTHPFGA